MKNEKILLKDNPIKDKIKNWAIKWLSELKAYKYYIFISVIIITFSTFINEIAGYYVTYSAPMTQVPDLILDAIGPWDWSFSFVYVNLGIFFITFLYPIIFEVAKIHKVLIQFALLSITRSCFVIMTHLQTPLDAIPVKYPSIFNAMAFTNDSFFSGHTAFPFLMFLVLKGKKIRWLFLAASIYMGITVLVTHRHYSIDVFAAYFITYSSYKIGEWIMAKTTKH